MQRRRQGKPVSSEEMEILIKVLEGLEKSNRLVRASFDSLRAPYLSAVVERQPHDEDEISK